MTPNTQELKRIASPENKSELAVVFEFPLENNAVAVGKYSMIYPKLLGDTDIICKNLQDLVDSRAEIRVNWPSEEKNKSSSSPKLCVATVRAYGKWRDMCTVTKNLRDFGVCEIPKQKRHEFVSKTKETEADKKKVKKNAVLRKKEGITMEKKLKRHNELLQRQKEQHQSNKVKKSDICVVLENYEPDRTPEEDLEAMSGRVNNRPKPTTPQDSTHYSKNSSDSPQSTVINDNLNGSNHHNKFPFSIESLVTPSNNRPIEEVENNDDNFGYSMAMAITNNFTSTPTTLHTNHDMVEIDRTNSDMINNNYNYGGLAKTSLFTDQQINKDTFDEDQSWHLDNNYISFCRGCDDLKVTNQNLQEKVEKQGMEIERLAAFLETDNTVSKIKSNLEQCLFMSRNYKPPLNDSLVNIEDHFQAISTNEVSTQEALPNKFQRVKHTSLYDFVREALGVIFEEEELAKSTLTGEPHGAKKTSEKFPPKIKLDERRVKEIREYAENYFFKQGDNYLTFDQTFKNAIKRKCNNAHNKYYKSA